MSWGHKSAADDHTKVKQKVAAAGIVGSTGDAEAERSQFVAALVAAAELAQYVGRPGDPVTVTLSGHANAGFVPGATQQTITVTVSNTQ